MNNPPIERRQVDRDEHPIIAFLNRCAHSQILAYVTIAFAISFGFHELEHRTDSQLANAVRIECHRENVLRDQTNARLAALKRSLDGQAKGLVVHVKHLPQADCKHIPKP